MNRGCPPTDRNARTGLFTPPGISCWASAKSLADLVVFITGAHPNMQCENWSRKRDEPQIASREVQKCRIRYYLHHFLIQRQECVIRIFLEVPGIISLLIPMWIRPDTCVSNSFRFMKPRSYPQFED